MEFSELQKDIIKLIATKEIYNLNSFYKIYFNKFKFENIAPEITRWAKEKPDLPNYCSIANTKGIVVNDDMIENIISFIDLWEKLENNGYIYSFERPISPYTSKEECYIPIYSMDDHENHRFDNDAFHIVIPFLNKKIFCTEDLALLVKNKFKTPDDRRFIISHRWTKITAITAIVFGLIASLINYYTAQNKNNLTTTDTNKVVVIKKVIIDSLHQLGDSTRRISK